MNTNKENIEILTKNTLSALTADLICGKDTDLTAAFFDAISGDKFFEKYSDFLFWQATILSKQIGKAIGQNVKVTPYEQFQYDSLVAEISAEMQDIDNRTTEEKFKDFNKLKMMVFKNNMMSPNNEISCYDFITLFEIAKSNETNNKSK